MKITVRAVAITISAALACLYGASQAMADCTKDKPIPQALLYSYIQKNGKDPDTYTVAGVGNQDYLLDPDSNPILPEELAAKMREDAKFKDVKAVYLVWPYSGWGNASYAHALAKILGKPVIGFAGPLWWYPNGTAVSTYARSNPRERPDKSNVAQCISSDGAYHVDPQCRTLLKKLDASKALYGNARFLLDCDDINNLELMAENGDPAANMRLFFYNFFVNIDGTKASLYMAKAAHGGDPVADYFAALLVKEKSPPDRKMYLKLLKMAADNGNKKAIQELKSDKQDKSDAQDKKAEAPRHKRKADDDDDDDDDDK